MNDFVKTKFAIASILIFLATFIIGLGVHRMCLEKQKADLYAAGEVTLAAHRWAEALAQFGMLSALDPSYRDVGDRLNKAHSGHRTGGSADLARAVRAVHRLEDFVRLAR